MVLPGPASWTLIPIHLSSLEQNLPTELTWSRPPDPTPTHCTHSPRRTFLQEAVAEEACTFQVPQLPAQAHIHTAQGVSAAGLHR